MRSDKDEPSSVIRRNSKLLDGKETFNGTTTTSRILYQVGMDGGYGHGESNQQPSPDYVMLVLQRWKSMLVLCVISFILSFLFARTLPKTYSTSAMVKLGTYAPPVDGPVGRQLRHETEKGDYLVSQVAMLSSFKIAEDVLSSRPELLQRLKNSGKRKKNTGLISKIQKVFGYSSEEPVEDVKVDEMEPSDNTLSQGILNRYLKSISYKMIHGTSLVRITAKSQDPYLAEGMANAHAQQFIELIQDNLARLARVNLEYLKERLVKSEKEYTDAERAALAYAKKHDLAGTNAGAIQRSLSQRYNNLFGKLHQLILNRAKTEAEYRELSAAGNSGGALYDPKVSKEYTRLSTLEGQIKVAKSQGLDKNNYLFDEIEEERDILLDALKRFNRRQVKSSEMEFRAANEAESLLRDELEKTQEEERRLYSKLVDFSAYRDTADAARKNFKEVRKRYEDALLNSQNEQNIVLLIDKARVPESSRGANTTLIVALGVLGSLVGSVFLTIAVDSVDKTIASIADLTAAVNLPVLGMIPEFGSGRSYGYGYEDYGYGMQEASTVDKITGSFARVSGIFTVEDKPTPSKTVRSREAVKQGIPMVEAPAVDPEKVSDVDSSLADISTAADDLADLNADRTQMFVRGDLEDDMDCKVVDCRTPAGEGFEIYEHVITHGQQWTRVSEAFREVFVAIQSFSREELKSILVASGDKGDGKSTVAANLAVVYAQSGRRTVLIDADIRLPSVQESIGVPEEAVGLSDFLAQEVSPLEIVYPTENEHLFVIPAGTLVGPSPQLGTGKRLSGLIELLADDFDTIIIDGPPVLHVADALTMSKMVDGVALVVRNGKTLRETAKWVEQRLDHIGSNVLGVVFNDVPRGLNFSRYT